MRTPTRLLWNDRHAHAGGSAGSVSAPPGSARAFHRRLPGYRPTPLVDLPAIASALGVGRVVIKDERERVGLPAFKILGASWATYRALCRRLGDEPEWNTIDELRAALVPLGVLTLTTATDGNHGRAVARMARLLGLRATIAVPSHMSLSRKAAIRGEGAKLVEVHGTYDDAVRVAAGLSADDCLVISDTSWPGYEEIPRSVIEGYRTIFEEVDEALGGKVDLVLVPLGVGSLSAAVARHFPREPGARPFVIGVEPTGAACVQAAIEAGRVVSLPGPHESIMSGLNCGEAASIALPDLQTGCDGFATVTDAECADAVRQLAAEGFDAGECSAAGLAALGWLLDQPRLAGLRGTDATVLLIATEGVTDPAAFERIVGRAPVC